MDEPVKKRVRRTPEQMAAEIDSKISTLEQALTDNENKCNEMVESFKLRADKIKEKIAALQKQKETILSPKPPRKPRKTKKQQIDLIVKQASKSGLKPAEIAERLGIVISD